MLHKQKNLLPLFSLLLVALLLARPATVARADSGGENGDALWAQVFNPDGTLRSDLIDLGVIRQDVDWMPHILNFGLKAEFHVYATRNGTTVVMPSATTLFFMAMHPHESGLDQAASMLADGLGWSIVTSSALITRPKEVFAQVVQALGVWDAVKDSYVSPEQFADAVISEQHGIWSFGATGDVLKILKILMTSSASDLSLYTAFLVYPPDMCAQAPGGCAATPTPQPTPPPSVCAAPKVHQGEISGSARLLAPSYPLVVGQDPNKRGVDLEFRLTIEPTIYTWYEEVEHSRCVYVPDGTGTGCPSHPNNPYYREEVWTDCVAHRMTFHETPNWIVASATLSETSRRWILRELSIRYPGAYLHHPDWKWSNPPQAQAGFQGNTFVWTLRLTGVQVADPGWYDMVLEGHTSGTPVTAGRPFHITAGRFPVYLITSTLIR